MNLVIYGAQAIALGAYKAIKLLYPERSVGCFLVSSVKGNPAVLGGLPVREISEYAGQLSSEEKADTEVLIATPESVMPEIETYFPAFCGTDGVLLCPHRSIYAVGGTACRFPYTEDTDVYGKVL